jgi:hypothetical protein
MYNVQMVAIKPLYHDCGPVSEGQQFQVDNVTAADFEAAGLAARYRPPARIKQFLGKMFAPVENKMLTVSENKAALPTPPPVPPLPPIPAPPPMVAHRGRPAIMRTCPDCGARGTTVEMRTHKCPTEAA